MFFAKISSANLLNTLAQNVDVTWALQPTPAITQDQQPHFRLSQAEFVSLAARCAPGAPADTLLAVARTESGLNPNAISINRPKAAARLAGHADGELALAKQPKDRTEAKSWLAFRASLYR